VYLSAIMSFDAVLGKYLLNAQLSHRMWGSNLSQQIIASILQRLFHTVLATSFEGPKITTR
jgi:hypothetical protein